MPSLNLRNLYVPAGLALLFRAILLLAPEPAANAASRGNEAPAPVNSSAQKSLSASRRTDTAKVKTDRKVPLPEQFLAFDVSRPFGQRRESFDSDTWENFCRLSLQTGRRMVIVQARGSNTSNPYADLLLEGARKQGLRTAAYVFLNFTRSAPTGDGQVRKALAATGSEKKHVEFMVVDVESGAAGGMTPAERVNRIGQAVEAVTKAGIRPVIYAKNTGGRRGEWADLTGNATDFSYLPLWVPRYDARASLDLDGISGEGWQSFGGWDTRHGKQFANEAITITPFGLDADESLFVRKIIEGPTKPRPYSVSGMVSVVTGKAKRDKDSGEVVQPVRVINRSRSPILGPLSLILEGLNHDTPLVTDDGSDATNKNPVVKVESQSLEPGESIRAELRFAPTSSALPSYQPVVCAGSGELQ